MMTPLRRLPLTHLTPDAPDRELLDRYVRERDERAFAALVARHGRMVRAVCRRVLGHDADADDAVQATFLVLVRKATSIRDRNGLANWLFGVAHNVAAKARQTRTRRQAKEAKTPPRPPEAVASDFAELLHIELAKLPATYRAAVVLCDLEGQTIADAAKQLGIPTGTVASRLARGRTRLANRLRSLGLGVSVGLIATLLGESATAAAVVVNPTHPPHVHTLAEEAMRTLFISPKHAKLAAVVVGILTLVGVPTALVAQAGDRARESQQIKAPVPKEKDKKEHPIVGSWEPIGDGGAPSVRLVITFQADGKVKYEHGKQVEWGWYKLDAAKDPAEIEYATPARANLENKKPPFLGLVKVEDDVLTLCLSEKARPTEFKPTDEKSGVLSSQYRRVKGGEKRESINAPVPKGLKPDRATNGIPDGLLGTWELQPHYTTKIQASFYVTFHADGRVERMAEGSGRKWDDSGRYSVDATVDPPRLQYDLSARERQLVPLPKGTPFVGTFRIKDNRLTLTLSDDLRAELKYLDDLDYQRLPPEIADELRGGAADGQGPPPKAEPPAAPKKDEPKADAPPKIDPPKGFAPFFTLGQALVEWDGDDKLKVRIQVPVGRFLKLTDAKGQAAHVHDFHTPEAGPQGIALDDAELYDVAGNKKAKADWKTLLKGRTQVLYMPKQFHEPKSFRDQFQAFLKDDALILVVSDEVNKAFDTSKNLPAIESLPQAFPGAQPKPGDPAVPPPKPGGDPAKK